MSNVSSFLEVRERLFSMYSKVLANTLFGVWMQLVILDESEVKKNVCRSTYCRYLNQLKSAGVTWEKVNLNGNQRYIKMLDELNGVKAMLRKGVEDSQVNLELREKIMKRIGRVKSWIYLNKKVKKAYGNKKACSCVNNYTPKTESFDVASTVN